MFLLGNMINLSIIIIGGTAGKANRSKCIFCLTNITMTGKLFCSAPYNVFRTINFNLKIDFDWKRRCWRPLYYLRQREYVSVTLFSQRWLYETKSI